MQNFATQAGGEMISYQSLDANTEVTMEDGSGVTAPPQEEQLIEVSAHPDTMVQDGAEQVIHVATNAEGDVTGHVITIEPQSSISMELDAGDSQPSDHYRVVIEDSDIGKTYTVYGKDDGENSVAQEVCVQEAVAEEQTTEEVRMREVDLDSVMEVVTEYRCKFCTASYTDVKDFKEHMHLAHMNILETLANQQSQRAATTTQAVETQSENVENTSDDKQSHTVLHSLLSGEVTVQHSVACSTDMEMPIDDVLHVSDNVQDENPTDISQIATYRQVTGVTKADEESIKTNSQNEPAKSSVNLETNDKEVFLCGQCGLGFATIDDCKSHMIGNHNIAEGSVAENTADDIVYPPNKVSVATQVQVPERGKPGRKRKLVTSDDASVSVEKPEEDYVENEPEEIEVFETMGKRKVRPPRRLADVYVLSKRKHIGPSKTAHEPYKLKCSVVGCLARFQTDAALDLHTRCHVMKRVKGEAPFLCTECGKPFSQWRVLRTHLWQDHSVDTDLFSCDQCEFRAVKGHQMDAHREVHNTDFLFPCKICGKAFKQQRQLRNHQTIHNSPSKDDNRDGGDEEDVRNWYDERQCDICKRKFANQKCLRKHKEEVHGNVKPYLCPYCGHSASRKAMMELHVRVHTGDKPYRCDLCDYRTADHNSLRRHRMRHTGQKPYRCSYCSYSCIQATSLKGHMKLKHPGQEGCCYSCSLCSYRTVSKHNWDNHQEDHRNGLITTATIEIDVAEDPDQLPLQQVEEGGDPAQTLQLQINSSGVQAQSQTLASTTSTVIDGTQIMQISNTSDFHPDSSVQYQISPSIGYLGTVAGLVNQTSQVISTVVPEGNYDNAPQTVTVQFDSGTNSTELNATTIGQIQDGSYDASTGNMVYTIHAPASNININDSGQLTDGDIMVYTVAGQDVVTELNGQYIEGAVSEVQFVQETSDQTASTISSGNAIQAITDHTNNVINPGHSVQLVQNLDVNSHQFIQAGQQLSSVEQTTEEAVHIVTPETSLQSEHTTTVVTEQVVDTTVSMDTTEDPTREEKEDNNSTLVVD